MEYFICCFIGYGLGCVNPAYFISLLKHKDIRNSGTGNLGTTNTFMNFGKACGCAVLLFDMFKAFAAVWLCRALFPEMELASVMARSMAVIGHIFPFYLHFKGGKGIASLTGFILATDGKCFLFLLIVGCIAAVIVNYGCAISFSAASLFPVICSVKLQSVAAFAILTVCSMAIVHKHMDNIQKIRAHKEMPIRQFLGNYIFGRE